MTPTLLEVPLDLPPGFPVLITNRTDWWQPYVPPLVGLAASMIVAAAAFAGVLLTNRRTDRRELEKWRRETLEEWCSDVCVATSEVQHEYARAVLAETDEEINSAYDAAYRKSTQLVALSFKFLFFGEQELYVAAQALYQAAQIVEFLPDQDADATDAAEKKLDEEPHRRLGALLGEFIRVAKRTLNLTGIESENPPISLVPNVVGGGGSGEGTP